MTQDMGRLPKWAQHRMAKLEADEAYAKRRLAEVLGDNGPTEVCLASYGDAPVYLPKGQRVQFTIPTGVVEVWVARDRVEVRLNQTTGFLDALTVIPGGRNSLTVFGGR